MGGNYDAPCQIIFADIIFLSVYGRCIIVASEQFSICQFGWLISGYVDLFSFAASVSDDEEIQFVYIECITAWCRCRVESECKVDDLGVLLVIVTTGNCIDERTCRALHQCMSIVKQGNYRIVLAFLYILISKVE